MDERGPETEQSTPPVARTAPEPAVRRVSRAPRQEMGLLLVIALLMGALTVWGHFNKVPNRQFVGMDADGNRIFETVERNPFFNPDVLLNLAKETSFIAIMALGATFVIITGGIDLSVGSVYALSAVAGAAVLHYYGPDGPGAATSAWVSVPLGLGVCLLVGAACGLANGMMLVALRVHPFIITLGTMAIFRGIAFVFTKAQSITGYPEHFRDFVRWDLGGGLYPVPLLIMLGATLLAALFLRKTVTGLEIYAVGGNMEAARFSGLRVNRLLVLVYTLAGTMAGLSAVILLGYYGSASSDTGLTYELIVIASAVVGGAALTGGRGSALGCLLGAFLIRLIDQSIVILKLDQNYSSIIIGSVIILAVFLDRLNQSMTQQRLAAQAAVTETPGGGQGEGGK